MCACPARRKKEEKEVGMPVGIRYCQAELTVKADRQKAHVDRASCSVPGMSSGGAGEGGGGGLCGCASCQVTVVISATGGMIRSCCS